ncbi:Protein CBG27788 [Caenorhabditis briggsae]|uniref:Protein CBG27787 n=1 Tax=Caenorhabditis briggsae TaxID=6238 RepID=G2J6P9_CAEBR|nr:Protein CBG27787 [Caenorhabditis briggsae]XP_045099118.1 Protein CBG27788 [Caenorhabditis briggsae]CAR99554.1 Protein CBG27787 [Caenorhabditis briggsae]CAR99555.1 Protein CBG27788 [Caenorhabditis briggsae]
MAILSILDKLPAELLIVNVWHKRTEPSWEGKRERLVAKEKKGRAFLCFADVAPHPFFLLPCVCASVVRKS